jgi:DNA-binding transcriptional LysR family regulator
MIAKSIPDFRLGDDVHNAGIDFRQLRAFVVVAAELNFVRASERLHISQPALSQTIRQFESSIGVQLFDRNTRKVALTEAGEALLKDAQDMLKGLDQFVDKAQDHARGCRGSLKVGFLIGAGVDLMPQILRTFGERFPDVSVMVKEFDFSAPEAGISAGMDVSILRPPIGVEGIEFRTLMEEACVACLPASHRLAHADAVSIYDLLDDPIVAAPGGGVWRNYWTGDFYRGGRAAPVVHEAATVESELQAVASGRGISITAQSTARFYARPGVSFPVIIDLPPCCVSVALPRNPTVAACNFAQLAVDVATNNA